LKVESGECFKRYINYGICKQNVNLYAQLVKDRVIEKCSSIQVQAWKPSGNDEWRPRMIKR
jgi:hypothetical protein